MESALTTTDLWTPSRVAEDAAERLGYPVSQNAVKKSIKRGTLRAFRVLGPSSAKRKALATWAVPIDDARAWEPLASGRPARH